MLSQNFEKTVSKALAIAKDLSHEYVTLEHLLLALTEDKDAHAVLVGCGADVDILQDDIRNFLKHDLLMLVVDKVDEVKFTSGLQRIISQAKARAFELGKVEISGADVLLELFSESESHSVFFLQEQNITYMDVVNYVNYGVTKSAESKGNPAAQDPLSPIANSGYYLVYNSMNNPEQHAQHNKHKTHESSGSFEAKESEVLREYCTNLNEQAKEGSVDALIGRTEEIDRAINILARRHKNNPLLVGEPGVGKTAIAEGLAIRIVTKKVPKALENAIIYSLDIGSLLAGTRYRGDFEERVKTVVKELESNKNAVLFIDEIHTIIGAGATNGGALDASNLLKPFLSRGKIRCIGATTYKEYTNHLCKDRALVRRFQKIDVQEPSIKNTIKILNGIKSYYEQYHNVRYTKSAVTAAAKLSERYITDRLLPDKAIDVLDETGAYMKTHDCKAGTVVRTKDVEQMIARIMNIPCSKLAQSEIRVLQNLEGSLQQSIYGQDAAIKALVSSIKTAKTGLANPNKPLGSYLLTGPSGVGKTELVRRLADLMNMELVRIDMSEYSEAHTVSKMLGSPPGYVGYEQGGLLTDPVLHTPYCVLLLDEIEKAHKDIYHLLLQIMDYGRITDNNGRKVNFCNAIIVMTSNAGSGEVDKNPIGFDSNNLQCSNIDQNKEVNRIFSPEFRNRLDAVVPFNMLDKNSLEKIVEKFLSELKDQLADQNIKLQFDRSVVRYLLDKSEGMRYGARKINTIINDNIRHRIAEGLVQGVYHKHSAIDVRVKSGKLMICPVESNLISSDSNVESIA